MALRFTVGEMAKMTGITKQMLIFYDNAGVFSPKYVGENGYRYYTPDQLEVLDSVLILRELGVPLKDIKEHMRHLDAEDSLRLLSAQKEQVEERIRRLSLIRERLSDKIDSLRRPMEPGLRIVRMEESYLMTVPVGGGRSLLELDMALKKLLWQYPGMSRHYYEIGSLGLVEEIERGVCDRYEYGFLTLKSADGVKDAFVKPAGDYACAMHRGPYQTTGATYGMMMKELKKGGWAPRGYTYEYSILDSLTSSPDEYVTEIQMLVERASDNMTKGG